MLDVLLCRFCGVVRGVVQVSLRGVGMVRSHFMVAGFVMRCGFAMMTGRVLVVFRCLLMMFRCLLGHESSLSINISRAAWPE
jgi:hypothetical protein